jgi:hypothetical protein
MANNYGVHQSHCCYVHGCKYGDNDCPVVSGEVGQSYTCESCESYDRKEKKYKTFSPEELARAEEWWSNLSDKHKICYFWENSIDYSD